MPILAKHDLMRLRYWAYEIDADELGAIADRVAPLADVEITREDVALLDRNAQRVQQIDSLSELKKREADALRALAAKLAALLPPEGA